MFRNNKINKNIAKPIIIVSCNRSGSTLLFRNLSLHPALWSLYIESNYIFYKYFFSDLENGDMIKLDPCISNIDHILSDFYKDAHNKEFFKKNQFLKVVPTKIFQRKLNFFYKSKSIRLVEKTPGNCFRIPLIDLIFPDAKYILLIRKPEDVISSLMEGWKVWSNTYNDKWTYSSWHYVKPPGWKKLKNKPLHEICAYQWVFSLKYATADLEKYCSERYLVVKHEELISNTFEKYLQILDFCDLDRDEYFLKNINKSIYTSKGSLPKHDKWKTMHKKEIESVKHIFEPIKEIFY